jgi:hypothetical protein
MTDWRDEIEARAERGAPRGADEVFDAASVAEYAPMTPARGRRQAPVLVAAAVVVVGAIVAGVFAATNDDERATEPANEANAVDCSIFVKPDATLDQTQAIGTSLENEPAIDSFFFVDQQAAYEEFRELFADKPELIESVTPEVLPPSFRFSVDAMTSAQVEDLRSRYVGQPGVRDVTCSDQVRMPIRGDCQLFVAEDATVAQVDAIRRALDAHAGVAHYELFGRADGATTGRGAIAVDLVDERAETKAQLGAALDLAGVSAFGCSD